MTDKHDEFIQELRESGEIPDSWVERITKNFDASGLRQDLKATREQMKEILEERDKLRNGVLTTTFKNLNIPGNPSAFNLPSDLNPTDEEAVSTWAQDMGLIPKVETTPADTRAVHDRISAASNEGAISTIPTDEDLKNAKTEEEFYSLARKREAAIKASR